MQPHITRVQDNAVEADLIRRAIAKEEAAVRAIVQSNNRRLYRIARSILHDDCEAEDVLQEAYIRAFRALPDFRHDSSLATWLSRIVVNEALQRLRRQTGFPVPDGMTKYHPSADIIPFPGAAQQALDPERTMAQKEICGLLEKAIDALPDEFRSVLVARTIENLSVEETAELFGLKPETVKTRLHRARARLREELAGHLEAMFSDVFPFDGARCARFTNNIVPRLLLVK